MFDPCFFSTTPLNKNLQMDLNASSVPPVTEYSASQGSSGFSNKHRPGMDAAILLLAFKQGKRSLEG